LFGYIIGLGFPPFMKTINPLFHVNENSKLGINVLNCLSVALFVIILLVIVIANYSFVGDNLNNILSYTTFIAVIILLLFGLFIARKTEQTVGPITYYFSNEEGCKSKKSKYVMASGDLIKITPVFCVFILLLLFSYDPTDLGWKYMYILFYGLFLGVFVSGISYYGIEYFLIKQPIKQCDTLSQCNTILSKKDYEEEEDSSDVFETAKYNKNSFNVVKLIMCIALLIIIAYLFYNKNISN